MHVLQGGWHLPLALLYTPLLPHGGLPRPLSSTAGAHIPCTSFQLLLNQVRGNSTSAHVFLDLMLHNLPHKPSTNTNTLVLIKCSTCSTLEYICTIYSTVLIIYLCTRGMGAEEYTVLYSTFHALYPMGLGVQVSTAFLL